MPMLAKMYETRRRGTCKCQPYKRFTYYLSFYKICFFKVLRNVLLAEEVCMNNVLILCNINTLSLKMVWLSELINALMHKCNVSYTNTHALNTKLRLLIPKYY